jgi:hypothetical protein
MFRVLFLTLVLLAATPPADGAAPIEIELQPPLAASDMEPWVSWLETAFGAVRTVSSDYPVARLAVRLKAVDDADEAVVFGRVRRSAIPALEFYVDPEADFDELVADWRGFHEAAHLLIPFPGNRDIWFTEGLASYYQYLLQARAGVMTEEQAWTALVRGFQRGVDDPAGVGRDLRSLSPRMWRLNAFRRVYWTGAAFFLNVDVRLRQESGGRHSLDATLAEFHRCCMSRRTDWDARALIQQLGELSVPAIWRQEYQRIIDAPAEPSMDRALRYLGIEVSGTALEFSNRPRAAALRRAIAAPSTAAPGGLVVIRANKNDQSASSPASAE